jgi:hypothetical protein
MALIYFDAGAFVKLLAKEAGSDLAADLWDGCDAALSSRLAPPLCWPGRLPGALTWLLRTGRSDLAARPP